MTRYLGAGKTEIGVYEYFERDGQVYQQKDLGPFVWTCSLPAWERTFKRVLAYLPATVIAEKWLALPSQKQFHILDEHLVHNILGDCFSGPAGIAKTFYSLPNAAQQVVRNYFEETL